MTSTVIGWWMYELTNSVMALAFVGLSEVVPALSLALYAGHYIDKHEKRKLLIKCVFLYWLCILAFIFLSAPFAADHFNVWTIAILICAVIACTGAIRSFSGPGFSSIISQIVPREILSSAANITSATFLIASFIGHILGGFLIAFIGIQNTFIVVFIVVAIAFFFLTRLKTKPVFITSDKNYWASVKEGLNYVFKTKLYALLSLDLFAVLFGGAVAMVPVFSKDILHIGPIGFGWLNAAADIGSIITVLTLTVHPLRKNQGRILFFAVGGFGLALILFAISKIFWLSFAALLISGSLDGISVIIRSTYLQLKTPDRLKGRVMSINSMFINSSNELGQFESGVAAKIMGTVTSVVFGGLMTLFIAILTWIKSPALRKMEY